MLPLLRAIVVCHHPLRIPPDTCHGSDTPSHGLGCSGPSQRPGIISDHRAQFKLQDTPVSVILLQIEEQIEETMDPWHEVAGEVNVMPITDSVHAPCQRRDQRCTPHTGHSHGIGRTQLVHNWYTAGSLKMAVWCTR